MGFGLVAILFIPMFMGTFVTGMNVIRSIQANHAARVHGRYVHSWGGLQRYGDAAAGEEADIRAGPGSRNG